MRRLADRSLYLGIRLCVFLALLLFGMTLSLREAEAGTELRISPEFFVDETSGILFLCEVENERVNGKSRKYIFRCACRREARIRYTASQPRNSCGKGPKVCGMIRFLAGSRCKFLSLR